MTEQGTDNSRGESHGTHESGIGRKKRGEGRSCNRSDDQLKRTVQLMELKSAYRSHYESALLYLSRVEMTTVERRFESCSRISC